MTVKLPFEQKTLKRKRFGGNFPQNPKEIKMSQFITETSLGVGCIDEYIRCQYCGKTLAIGGYDRTDGNGDFVILADYDRVCEFKSSHICENEEDVAEKVAEEVEEDVVEKEPFFRVIKKNPQFSRSSK